MNDEWSWSCCSWSEPQVNDDIIRRYFQGPCHGLGFWFSDFPVSFLVDLSLHFMRNSSLPAVFCASPHLSDRPVSFTCVSPVFPPLCVSVWVVPSLFVVCFLHVSPVLFPVSPVFLFCSPVSSPCRVLSAFAAWVLVLHRFVLVCVSVCTQFSSACVLLLCCC